VCVESRGSLGAFVFALCFCGVHSAVTPGEGRFRLHCNGALMMGINAKLRRGINSPDFSTCLLLIQLVWVAVDITSYNSLNRVDIKSQWRHHLLECDSPDGLTQPEQSGLVR